MPVGDPLLAELPAEVDVAALVAADEIDVHDIAREHGLTTHLTSVPQSVRALLELTVEGIETSRDFHLRMMENDDFRRGDISIQWLEQQLPGLLDVPAPEGSVLFPAVRAETEYNGPVRIDVPVSLTIVP